MHGGLKSNIIAPEVKMTGTIRTIKPQVQKDLYDHTLAQYGSADAVTLYEFEGTQYAGGYKVRSGESYSLELDIKGRQSLYFDGFDKPVVALGTDIDKSFDVLVNGNMNWNCSVQGVTPEFLAIRSLEIDYGSFISTNDLDKRNRVCVIGTTVAENLFENQNPVGQTIRIKNQPFKVIGLLKSKGQSSMGQDQDDMVYIPLTTAQERMLGITYVQSINLQVSDSGKMDQVQAEVEQLLRERHHITNGKDDDFHVRNLTSLMETVNQSTSMLTLLLGSIAGISLLVGGIGIMNIMMVSVTERTREIGIRKALGATFQNIMMQFLIESVVIGVIGGLLGIACGVGIALAIAKSGLFQTVITAAPIIISFSFSVGIGLFFGIYPARKAAKLDPIEALRYE
ncbi:ABC transporter permease [uncultured Megasphaera sp.]|uniref:ABC transporter permease n=1 Tax=uncultured Megasphaera sp. TaxID=165188 RepID=UPI00258C847A|nr:ABC transporter permease [uncultured Megasphaera sp.]